MCLLRTQPKVTCPQLRPAVGLLRHHPTWQYGSARVHLLILVKAHWIGSPPSLLILNFPAEQVMLMRLSPLAAVR